MRTVNVVPIVLIVFFCVVCVAELCYSVKKKLPVNKRVLVFTAFCVLMLTGALVRQTVLIEPVGKVTKVPNGYDVVCDSGTYFVTDVTEVKDGDYVLTRKVYAQLWGLYTEEKVSLTIPAKSVVVYEKTERN